MDKFIKSVVCVIFAAMSCALFAYNGGYENSLDYVTNPGVGYGNYDTTLTSVKDLPAAVPANAYAQCKYLTSVDLTGVTSIGDAAFAYSALESVTIPASVQSIGYIAFGGCTNLKSVTVSNWNWYDVNKEPFRDCDALTTLNAYGPPPDWDVKSVFGNLQRVVCLESQFLDQWIRACPNAYVSGVAPTYWISVDYAGGQPGAGMPMEANYGDWGVLPNPNKTGYVFAGWKAVSGLGPEAACSTDNVNVRKWQYGDVISPSIGFCTFANLSAEGGVILQAQWIYMPTYSIVADYAGGQPGAGMPTEANRGDWGVLPNPTRAGYVFAGWKALSGLGPDAVCSTDNVNIRSWREGDVIVPSVGFCTFSNLAAEREVTIQAQWELAPTYSIVADYAGGQPGEGMPTEAKRGDWGVLPNPTRAGCVFAGWKALSGLGPDAVCSTDNVNIRSWREGDVIVPSIGFCTFANLAAENEVTIQAQWKTATQGDPIPVSSAGVVDGRFCLTLPALTGEYGVWTNANLSVPVSEWGLMEMRKAGGESLEFKLEITPGVPQLFFRVFSVEYK